MSQATNSVIGIGDLCEHGCTGRAAMRVSNMMLFLAPPDACSCSEGRAWAGDVRACAPRACAGAGTAERGQCVSSPSAINHELAQGLG